MERIDVGKKIDCGIQTLDFFVLKNFALLFEFNFGLFTDDKVGWIKMNPNLNYFCKFQHSTSSDTYEKPTRSMLDNGNDFAKATTLQDVKIAEYRLVGVSE